MKLALILDTETTGLTVETAKLIEIGAVLFDIEHRAPIAQLSTLLPCASNPVEHINRISSGLTNATPLAVRKSAADLLRQMAESADVYLAHNVAFDRQWLGALPDRPWICTMDDCRWPRAPRGKARLSVTALALAYEVPVWAAHRAMTDCIYLAQVMEREPALSDVLEQAQQPRTWWVASLSYEKRQLAKDAGFVWDQQVPKAWARKMTIGEAQALPFEVRPVASAL